MQDLATLIPAADAASLMGWWKDMGVDTLVDEAPVPWLGRVATAKQAVPAPAQPNADATPEPAKKAALPDNVPALIAYLSADADIPEAGPPARRIAASGDPKAPLMILIDMPESRDHEVKQLLSGEAGALFDKMLLAIKRDRTNTYIVALCPGRPPSGMLPDRALTELAEIAKHHVALAAPERLWLMGRSASRAILGMDDISARGRLHKINHDGSNVIAVASFHPRLLLQTPARKAAAWADMQMLVEGMTA